MARTAPPAAPATAWTFAPRSRWLQFTDAENRFPRALPAPRLARPGAQVRRRALSGDPPHRRWAPPHLQRRPLLPRDLVQDLGREGAHGRLRALRRAGAGDQHRAGDVLLLGQAA